ncbi:alkaline-phosphatase-like protein [Scenedesmus sp. NREL 46B-D3]|nr:alkaline-phosphatase-like protein [Scenedesmus sp. NREL 46B-D3]
MSFTNFYSSSLCAISRAALLTGRDAVRTGNVFNGFGYDSFSLQEATMGDVLQQVGYVTSHYGKCECPSCCAGGGCRHNGHAQGYEPWNRGFNESWLPDDYVHLDNLMRNPKKSGAPAEIEDAYFSPRSYLRKIESQQPKPDPWTARLWAMLMYIDDVLGLLVEYVERSPLLRTNTYIMVAGDNGPALPAIVQKKDVERLRRMPSGMLGDKNTFVRDIDIRSSGTEGSLRNHLAVWGPGVPSGAVRDELLSLPDVVPTMEELAGASDTRHMPWTGLSFANLLVPAALPTPQQENRFLFTFVVSGADGQCPHVDRLMTELLPDLNADRHKDFKWYGSTDKLFRLSGGSHIELPCNEVTSDELSRVSTLFSRAARRWWSSVVAEPTSFTKIVYNIGQAGTLASNVEASGAIAIERGDVNVTSNVIFKGLGHACVSVNIATRGMYAVNAMYRNSIRGPKHGPQPEFIVAVGQWRDIVAGTAPSLTNVVGRKVGASGSRLGTMFLEKSKGERTEACIKILGLRVLPNSDIKGVARSPPPQQQLVDGLGSSSNSSITQNSSEASAVGDVSSLGDIPATAAQYGNAPLNHGGACTLIHNQLDSDLSLLTCWQTTNKYTTRSSILVLVQVASEAIST